MPLSATHQRSEYGDLLILEFFIDVVHDLLFAELDHLLACVVGMGFAGPRKKETEEIIDLCNRPDGTPGILIRRLLFDGYHRAEPRNLIHVRSFHIADKLAGVRP